MTKDYLQQIKLFNKARRMMEDSFQEMIDRNFKPREEVLTRGERLGFRIEEDPDDDFEMTEFNPEKEGENEN